MKLTDWLAITDGRVTEGSEFGFACYGNRVYSMSYWNGLRGEAEASTHVVYDRDTLDVFETDVYDGDKNKAYVWRRPGYATAYKQELAIKNIGYEPDWPEIELESLEDYTEKAMAIMNGEEYDDRVKVPLNLEKDELFALMSAAHERDITLNELIAEALSKAIDAELDKSEQKAPWPFNFDQLITRVTWANGESEDFIGIWNTIKDMEIVSTDYGQFCGGITSHKYETPVYEYTVIWYDGDTDKIPDEITRVNK
jgi:hypothetical protein